MIFHEKQAPQARHRGRLVAIRFWNKPLHRTLSWTAYARSLFVLTCRLALSLPWPVLHTCRRC